MPEDTVIEDEAKEEEGAEAEEQTLGPLTLAQITSGVTPPQEGDEPEKEEGEAEEKPDGKPAGLEMLSDEDMTKSVNVQLDGRKVTMPVKEAIKGYIREDKFTQKLTELAQVRVIVDHLVDNPKERNLWLDRVEAQKKGEVPGPVEQKEKAKGVELPDLSKYEMAPEINALLDDLVTTVNAQSEKIRQLSGGYQNIQDGQAQTAEQAQDDADLYATTEDARVRVEALLGEEIDPKEFRTFVGQHLDAEGCPPGELHANAKTPDWFFMKAKSAYGERISNKQLEEYKKAVGQRTPKRIPTGQPIRTKGKATPSNEGSKIDVNEHGISKDPSATVRTLAQLQNAQRAVK